MGDLESPEGKGINTGVVDLTATIIIKRLYSYKPEYLSYSRPSTSHKWLRSNIKSGG